jgi:hypothetical protein
LRRFEAAIGAARPLTRLRDNQPRGVQDPADGRGRRHVPALALESAGDADRSSVKALRGQIVAQLDDPLRQCRWRLLRIGARSVRARLDRLQAAVAVVDQQLVNPLTRDTELRSGLRGRSTCWTTESTITRGFDIPLTVNDHATHPCSHAVSDHPTHASSNS